MIKGVTVDVLSPTDGALDRFGNKTKTYAKTSVRNVLVVPGATTDMEASRPEGVTIDYTLHFPKTFSGSLEGCRVELPAPWAGTYDVVGAPSPYIDENTPTPWHMPVEVVHSHG